jgi:diaminopimelate epimerase
MQFTKMHGLGNDYVYVNGFSETVADPVATAIKISDRHFGIGSDGLILILPPGEGGDARMRMFNADGSESEMCGNGVRCVAKYVHDHNLSRNNPLKIETGRGILTLALHLGRDGKVDAVTVDMGAPILDLPKVPVNPEHVRSTPRTGEYLLTPVPAGLSESVAVTFVSMGNPHATFFVPDVKAVELEKVGPLIERHPAFPRRVNVHFVQMVSRSELIMRTWERGSGITMACGTGACAVAVSAAITGRAERRVLAHLPGGDLELTWDTEANTVFMKGPATEVFAGEYVG